MEYTTEMDAPFWPINDDIAKTCTVTWTGSDNNPTIAVKITSCRWRRENEKWILTVGYAVMDKRTRNLIKRLRKNKSK